MIDKRKLCFLIFILGLVFFFSCSGNKKPGIKSVILITIDTLRSDHLSCYGYPFSTSPNIDAFIQRGTRFKWAFSTSSSTMPAHASILLGVYPSFHSVGIYNGENKLIDSEITLAELCLNRGMKTAAVVSNPLLSAVYGFNQGFQEFDDDLPRKELNRNWFEKTADLAIERAVKKLNEFKDHSFFLWLHLQDPHGPYTPPHSCAHRFLSNKQYYKGLNAELPFSLKNLGHKEIPAYQKYGEIKNVRDYIGRYDGEITFLDSQINILFKFIDKMNLLDNTLVIITADHGEAFGEDGFYFCHESSCGLDQVSVPLAFIGPGIKSRVITNHAVSSLDIFATVLDFLNIEIPGNKGNTQSTSLKKILEKGIFPRPYPIFFESRSQQGAVLGNLFYRQDRTKLPDASYFIDEYNKDSDRNRGKNSKPGKGFIRLGDQLVILEKRSGKKMEPSNLKELLRHFSYLADNTAAAKKDGNRKVILKKRMLENLRSLGYID